MKITFLGTAAALPTASRGLSCTCVQREGEILMFDAGEGAQTAYLRAGLGWNKPMRIFVTHLHGDHCIGILGLLQTMSMRGRGRELEIYGPPGIEEFVAANIRILNFGIRFPLAISSVGEGVVVDGGRYEVTARRAAHSLEAYSYVLEERPLPGRFDRERALALGVPCGPDWGELQAGRPITAGGRVVNPPDVLGPPRPGIKIGISGDTRPSDHLREFFSGCDYLIFESTFGSDMRDRALETFHSTAREAAVLARDARAAHLVLTHFSARYADTRALVDEAAEVHGSVTGAEDMMTIEV